MSQMDALAALQRAEAEAAQLRTQCSEFLTS